MHLRLLTNHLILKCGDFPGLIRCSRIITKAFIVGRGMQKKESIPVIQSEKCKSNARKARPAIAKVEMEKEYRWPPADGQGKEMDFPLAAPKRNAPC